MNKFEKYSSYKDSGVEWLGEIPEHWKIMKLSQITKFITCGLASTPVYVSSDSGKPFLSAQNVRPFKMDYSKYNYISFRLHKQLTNNRKIQKGDILLTRVGAGIGDVAIFSEDLDCAIYVSLTHIRNVESVIDNYYLMYFFGSTTAIAYHFNGTISAGGQGNLNVNNVRQYRLPIPPKDEQTKIASFLDEKTAQIDEVISQKEKLIELLKERKQIVINDAVTKGEMRQNHQLLDDFSIGTKGDVQSTADGKDVEFVDSGVEWIGKIPKGWEVKKLKFIIKNKLKYGANESGISYDEALPRYVRITDFSDTGKLSEKNKLSLSWDKGKDYLLKDGDVLFARSGATVGKTYQFKKSMSIEKNYAFAGYLIKAEANETMILSDYLYLYTNSNLFNRWKESIFNKATIENIGADKYSELFFTLPSIEEQKLILKNYFIKSTKIDKAIELQQNYISKLKEYKASLIDSVVTGKVKV